MTHISEKFGRSAKAHSYGHFRIHCVALASLANNASAAGWVLGPALSADLGRSMNVVVISPQLWPTDCNTAQNFHMNRILKKY